MAVLSLNGTSAGDHAKSMPAKGVNRFALGIAALGVATGGVVAIAPQTAGACASKAKDHGGYMMSDGTRTFTFPSTGEVKQAAGCADTNVSYSDQAGYMRGRYQTSSGTVVWGSSTVYVSAGTQSPWKVVISNLSAGRNFNHGHENALCPCPTTTWQY